METKTTSLITRKVMGKAKPPVEEEVETDFTKNTSTVHQNTMTQPLTIAQKAQSAQKAQDAMVGGRLHHFCKVWKEEEEEIDTEK